MVARPPLIRDLNQALLLSYLREKGPVSRRVIQAELGFSKATLNALLQELLGQGILLEEEGSRESRGRPAKRIGINPDAAYSMGLIVEAKRLLGAWADYRGEVRGYAEQPLQGTNLGEIFQALDALLKKAQASLPHPERIFTLAIGVPGSVDPEGRVRLAPKLPALEGIALASLLRTRYGLTILVENDAKLAVLGELWAGDARGLANFAFLLVKEGIGAGLVLEGKLFRESRGLAGEIGYVPCELEGMDGPHLEEVLSLQGPGGTFPPDRPERYAQRLAQAVIILTAVADLEVVFLGMDPADHLPSLIPKVSEYLGRTPYEVSVRASRLSLKASLYGAIALALGETHEATLARLQIGRR